METCFGPFEGDLAEIGQLTFEKPDSTRFPALRLSRQALQIGGSAPTILNAANEVAVQGFLDRRLGFLDIAEVVERTLERMSVAPLKGLDDVWQVDDEARRIAIDLFDSSL